MRHALVACLMPLLVATSFRAVSQDPDVASVPTSVDAHLVLDAAGPEQRKSLDAIYMVVCPNVGGKGFEAGTGFVLDSGVMVTNAHVVATCDEKTLVALTSKNSTVRFSKIIPDSNRDLALLVPATPIKSELRLASKDDPPPGTTVSTWGYPLLYNGASPLLSVGYVSGYREDESRGKPVKHIVVNGAFNHGNSGGPLLVARTHEVIGVVVLTYHFYPPGVKGTIDALAQQKWGMMWNITGADGKPQQVSEAQVTAAILEEFYEKTQVMIGEAISASELRALLSEHSSDLPRPTGITAERTKAAKSK
jgi:S1-C subfamily serine protease